MENIALTSGSSVEVNSGRGRGRARGRGRKPAQKPRRKRYTRKKEHRPRPTTPVDPSQVTTGETDQSGFKSGDCETSLGGIQLSISSLKMPDKIIVQGSDISVENQEAMDKDGEPESAQGSNMQLDTVSDAIILDGGSVEMSVGTVCITDNKNDDTPDKDINSSMHLPVFVDHFEDYSLETPHDNLKDHGCHEPEISPALHTPSPSSEQFKIKRPLSKTMEIEPLLGTRESLNPTVPMDYDLLKIVKLKVDTFLFHRWHALVHLDAIHAVFVSAQNNVSVQRSIVFSTNGDVELFVHCQPVDINPFLQNATNPLPLSYTSVNNFVHRITTIVNNVRKMEVCSGYGRENFKAGWETCPFGKVDENPYDECRYSETFRSLNCKRLVKRSAWRCSECATLGGPLQRRAHFASLQPHPNTANIYLTEGQKLQKLQELHRKLESGRKKISRPQEKIGILIEKEGFNIDKSLSDDLSEILLTSKITPAQSIFLQQQVNTRTAGLSNLTRTAGGTFLYQPQNCAI